MRRHFSTILLAALATVLTATLATAGEVYLGITMDDVTASMARALQMEDQVGVLINEVIEGSPAEVAGLRAGDVILAIGDRDIKGTGGLSRVVRSHEPGDEVPLRILREGKRKTIKVTLGEREKRRAFVAFGAGDDTTSWSWSTEEDFLPDIVRNLGIFSGDRGFLGIVPGKRAPDGKGVIIESLVEDGAAASAGLMEGDIIVAIDGEPITSGDDLQDVLGDTKADQTVKVSVVRDGKTHDIEVTLGEGSLELELRKGLRMFMSDGRDGPRYPRSFEFHGGDFPDLKVEEKIKLERLKLEQQELTELKDELSALKDELKKLREELRKDQ